MAKQIELFDLPAGATIPVDATPDLASAQVGDLLVDALKPEITLDIGDAARTAILNRMDTAFGGSGKAIAFSGVMVLSGPDAGKIKLQIRGHRVIRPAQLAAQKRAGNVNGVLGEVVDK